MSMITLLFAANSGCVRAHVPYTYACMWYKAWYNHVRTYHVVCIPLGGMAHGVTCLYVLTYLTSDCPPSYEQASRHIDDN